MPLKFLNPSLSQIVADLEAARSELHQRRLELVDAHTHWTHPTDARVVMVARMEGLAQSAQLGLAFTGAYLVDWAWWKELSDGSRSTHRQAIESFELFTRRSFLSGVFAAFENGCRIALRHLRPDDKGVGERQFHRVLDGLRSELPSVPSEAWPLVDLLRHMRNTTHNNGVVFDPQSKDRTVTYSGRTYRFEHGKHVEFATWAFLTKCFLELGVLSCRIAAAPPLAAARIVEDPAYT